MLLELRIANPSGASFNINLKSGATLADLREAIETQTGFDPISQRLVLGGSNKELRGNGALQDSLAGLALDGVVELVLLRRTSDQVLWLQRLERQTAKEVKRWLGKQPPGMRADREVMLEAVAMDSRCLQLASEELKGHGCEHEFWISSKLQVCKLEGDGVPLHSCKDGYALKYADDDVKADRDIVLVAVTSNGGALGHADPDLQDDKEVVITAVRNYGHALYHASPDLRADREVVVAAVAQDPNALKYATVGLRADKQLVRMMQQNVIRSSL